MTKLSVNINKIATLRNARGGTVPNLVKVAQDCERFGAMGITIHPRPDERHIKYADVADLNKVNTTEFNIEGYPNEQFMELVLKTKPTQVTLVPDSPNVLTSNAGWDTVTHQTMLTEIIGRFKVVGIRTSVFIETDPRMIEHAKKAGADRIELYTESYASRYSKNREDALRPFIASAEVASGCELGINAGHDLSLENLQYFSDNVPDLLEVSIGHALICDALYYGLENTIQMYLKSLRIYETQL